MAQLSMLLVFLTALLLNTACLPVPTIAKSMSHSNELSTSVSPAHNNILARNNLPISDNGLCGSNAGLTCLNSLFGDSCSEWGFCGSYYETDYAGPGCQTEYGICNPDLASASGIGEFQSTSMVAASTTEETDTERTADTGIIILPVTTTVVDSAAAPAQTVSGRFGFCGVRGSSC